MHRGYALIVLLLVGSLACGVVSTVTPSPSSTSIPPTQSAARLPPTGTATSLPAATQGQAGASTATPASTAERTKTPYPTSVLDNAMSAEINLIQSQVIQSRGLKPEFAVPVVLLSPEELRKNVVNDFFADYTDEKMADDVLELSIIGLLQPGFDLRGLYIDLLSEQVAGYYDNDVAEMFVVKGKGFDGPERLTYAHEFTHVLQDQNYDIKHGLNYNNDACDLDTERCAAIQSLIEGDATLSEFTWFQGFATQTDQQQIVDYYNSLSSPVYNTAPAFLKDDFVFPYNQGLSFVQHFFDQGGWEAVDALYKNPPVSTEQILHPELYPSDTPIKVDLPDLTTTLGDGWREVRRNQMGEWYTYLILAQAADEHARLDDGTAKAAAAGWGGDEYLVLHNDSTNQTAFVMKTVWDTSGDATEFANAMQIYGNARFGVSGTTQGGSTSWSYADGYSSLSLSADTTIWIVAPDATIAQTIFGAIQP